MKNYVLILVLLFTVSMGFSQTTQCEVNNNTEGWVSVQLGASDVGSCKIVCTQTVCVPPQTSTNVNQCGTDLLVWSHAFVTPMNANCDGKCTSGVSTLVSSVGCAPTSLTAQHCPTLGTYTATFSSSNTVDID